MHRTTRIKITELNPHLICVLCGGYYIDAATIIECLHSFCRTCIVRYLESSKYCPICDVMVHKTKPLQNVKSDKTLQDLVYKLVPGLYKSEMKRRRDLYNAHPEAAHHCTGPCEEKGDEDQDRLIYTYDEKISLSLELYSECVPEEVLDFSTGIVNPDRMKKRDVRYLQCPAAVTIGHLKKFIRMKFDLPPRYKIDIFHSFEPLDDLFTLMDVAYIYTWRRQSPLRLVYTVFELARNHKRKYENEQTVITEKQPSTIEDVPKETPVAERDTSPMQPAMEASPPSQTTPTPATAPAPVQTVTPVTRDETQHAKESSFQVKQNGKDPAQKEASAPVIKKNTSKYMDRLSCQAPTSLSKGLLSKHPVESAGFKPLEDVNSFSNNSGSVYDFNDGRDSPVPAFTSPSGGGGENGSKGALKQTSGKKRKLANGKLSYIAESRLQEQVISSKTKVTKDSTKTNKPTTKEKKQGLFDIRGKVKSSKFNGIYTPHVLNGHISN
ncbi:polycomb complex protein BMI-1-A-like [Mizuhopecten yessoensis]|uniref:Polycomb complex protein BMI-1 n=1 Tax=Mizuhopecten yessoensis TaxID=6573 RepID=A0A210QZZ0_MIZYE|nr:polycomb complex protein BMI-1-A-like [Mizuhopecten yessoensis]XP_021345572.1 polycomb complex protein BMI-1-A-like [Mizuhopecten yessoensis]OWF54297.1 Polycomb complex protein BMI-1 [Mizuhopecten yessoensis]